MTNRRQLAGSADVSGRAGVKLLDALCRRYIFLRDRDRCQKCGRRDRLQWAHIHTRATHSLRWEPDNSLVLCSGCHLQGHLHPTEFADWFRAVFPHRFVRLRLLRQTRRRVDRGAVRLWLEQQTAKLEGL